MVAALKNSRLLSPLPPKAPAHPLSFFSSVAKLPKATYNEDIGRTTCSRKVMRPLQIERLPIALSFGVFDS